MTFFNTTHEKEIELLLIGCYLLNYLTNDRPTKSKRDMKITYTFKKVDGMGETITIPDVELTDLEDTVTLQSIFEDSLNGLDFGEWEVIGREFKN